MNAINYFSIVHFLIWFLIAKYSKIGWTVFLILSIGWELIELVLPFQFATETLTNKVLDIVVNITGFGLGLMYNKKRYA